MTLYAYISTGETKNLINQYGMILYTMNLNNNNNNNNVRHCKYDALFASSKLRVLWLKSLGKLIMYLLSLDNTETSDIPKQMTGVVSFCLTSLFLKHVIIILLYLPLVDKPFKNICKRDPIAFNIYIIEYFLFIHIFCIVIKTWFYNMRNNTLRF